MWKGRQYSDCPAAMLWPSSLFTRCTTAWLQLRTWNGTTQNNLTPSGDFHGKATLHVKEDAKPTIDPPRKCSVHLKQKIKAELDDMQHKGIIRKIEHHTDWCSSMTTVVKKDGSIRLCLDPKRLNDAMKRCPHKTPTLEEINPYLRGSTILLETWREGWLLVCSSGREITGPHHLPHSLREILFPTAPIRSLCQSGHIPATHGQDHRWSARVCMHCGRHRHCWQNWSKSTTETCANSWKGRTVRVSCSTVKNAKSSRRASHSLDRSTPGTGVHPDPAKVEAIQSLATPQDKEDVQRCLGLFTYLSSYISNFSERAAPLRELLKKDTPFLMAWRSRTRLHRHQERIHQECMPDILRPKEGHNSRSRCINERCRSMPSPRWPASGLRL